MARKRVPDLQYTCPPAFLHFTHVPYLFSHKVLYCCMRDLVYQYKSKIICRSPTTKTWSDITEGHTSRPLTPAASSPPHSLPCRAHALQRASQKISTFPHPPRPTTTPFPHTHRPPGRCLQVEQTTRASDPGGFRPLVPCMSRCTAEVYGS